ETLLRTINLSIETSLFSIFSAIRLRPTLRRAVSLEYCLCTRSQHPRWPELLHDENSRRGPLRMARVWHTRSQRYESMRFLPRRLRWLSEGHSSQNNRQFVAALNEDRFRNQRL